MATRINMMKMLQEVRGFAEITTRRPHSRPPEPVVLQGRSPSPRAAKRKRTLTITIQDPPDIPHPVEIIQLKKP